MMLVGPLWIKPGSRLPSAKAGDSPSEGGCSIIGKTAAIGNPSDVVNNYLTWGELGQAPGRDPVELFGLLPFDSLNVDVNAATVLPRAPEARPTCPFILPQDRYRPRRAGGSRRPASRVAFPIWAAPRDLPSSREPSTSTGFGFRTSPSPRSSASERRPARGSATAREEIGRSTSPNRGWPTVCISRASICDRMTASTRARWRAISTAWARCRW